MVRISIIWKSRSFVVATGSQIVSVTLCKNRSIKTDRRLSLTITNYIGVRGRRNFPAAFLPRPACSRRG
jgi:hypothetical protein